MGGRLKTASTCSSTGGPAWQAIAAIAGNRGGLRQVWPKECERATDFHRIAISQQQQNAYLSTEQDKKRAYSYHFPWVDRPSMRGEMAPAPISRRPGPGDGGTSMTASEKKPITIKKYANRRLYNTGTSTYVTLEDLAAMVKVGEDFAVFDAKTGEEITRSVLA
jgi:hypothetical protein